MLFRGKFSRERLTQLWLVIVNILFIIKSTNPIFGLSNLKKGGLFLRFEKAILIFAEYIPVLRNFCGTLKDSLFIYI
jgi:hypothetical protein